MFFRERGGPQVSPASEDGGDEQAIKATDISRVDVHEITAARSLNALNENIRSLREVNFPAYGVARPSTLLSLSLHSNRLSSLEGFSSVTALITLNLSSNELDGDAIRSCAPHLGGLSSLESLDLSCNRIDALLGMPFLPRLSRLLVPYNRLESLDGVQALASSLTHLDARDNRIAGPTGIHAPHLAALGRLKSLVLVSPGRAGHPNPVTACDGYRRDVFAASRSLQMLDGEAARGLEVAAADAGRSASATAVAGGPPPPHFAGAAKRGGKAIRRRSSSSGSSEKGIAGATRGILDTPAFAVSDDELAAVAEVAPEEVPVMPRFDALAGRFRSFHRSRGAISQSTLRSSGGGGGGGGKRGGGGGRKQGRTDVGKRLSAAVSSMSSDEQSSLSEGGWSEGGDDDGRERHEAGDDIGRAREAAAVRLHPEETASGAVAGRRKGWDRGDGNSETSLDGIGGSEGGDGNAEDAAEEHGLLSRLRSVAQEARLEVMDSRLQDLHEKQAQEAAGARRAAAAGATAAASHRSSVSSSGRRVAYETGSRGGGRSNPWAQQQAARPGAAGSRSATRNLRGSRPARVSGGNAAGDRPRTWPHAIEEVAPAVSSGGGGGDRDKRSGGGLARTAAARGTRPVRLEEAPPSAGCPCCRSKDAPESTVAGGAGAAASGGCVLERVDGSRSLESPPRKHLSDASTQADRGPVAAAFRTSGVGRTRHSSAVAISASVGARCNPGDVSVGRAVAAAAVVGAAAATLTAFDDRRLAVCFLRWARDTDRAKTATAAAASDAALATAREEAQREREAWEALQATLEGSAAAREREAREAAQEEGRKELRLLSTACRSAEETVSALTLQLAQAEANASAAVLKQQQAQAEAARAKADAEASVAAIETRANAGVERLEEQLKGKARAESEAEEESRRVRALLREAESRCRGLQDQVEESRARERRASADAEDARRRAAVDADKKLAAAVDSERDRILALKHKLEAAEDAARAAAKAGRAAAEGEASGRRAATELAELAREQKAALQAARGEIRSARAEKISTQKAADAMKAEAARKNAEVQELRRTLEAREAELGAERQARRQQQNELRASEEKAEALIQEKEEAEAKAEASAIAQEDLRAAVMVKDKVLEDRENLVKELRLREGDALAEAQGWRDRLEAQQSEADLQLDAAREEVSELQAQVVALSGVEDQLREVFKELRRYRKRHEADEDGGRNGDGDQRGGEGGASSQDCRGGRQEEDCATEFTAVAAVTAAAKAVEEELRGQLDAKDQALRYVESELLGMKSLFDDKEASLRRELGEEREKLEREAAVLRQRLEEAEAGRAAAEEVAKEQALAMDTLRSNLRSGERRSKELEDALSALLVKHTADMASAKATSRKLTQVAALVQDQDAVQPERLAPSHGPSPSFSSRDDLTHGTR